MLTAFASAVGPLLLLAEKLRGSYDLIFNGLAVAAFLGMTSWYVAFPSRGVGNPRVASADVVNETS
jgi:hypothetical protein